MGVADKQQAGLGGGHDRVDALVYLVANAFGLVHHDEHVGTVEALELVGGPGRQSHGVAVLGQFPTGVEHGAAQFLPDGPVKAADLPPENVAHLAKGGGGAEDDGGVMAVEEPEHGGGGAEPLAQPVARFNRHPAVGRQGSQHLLLFFPEPYP